MIVEMKSDESLPNFGNKLDRIFERNDWTCPLCAGPSQTRDARPLFYGYCLSCGEPIRFDENTEPKALTILEELDFWARCSEADREQWKENIKRIRRVQLQAAFDKEDQDNHAATI